MPWSSPLALVLSAALAPPASPSSEWSDDGSAEAALLRKRVEAHDDAEAKKELGQRGLVFVADPSAAPEIPTTQGGDAGQVDTPSDDPGSGGVGGVVVGDLTKQAELERIVRKGRRLFIPGIVFATLGTILALAGGIVIIKYPTPPVGGVLGVGLGLSAIGWPMAVVGIHKRKHPEKYLRNLSVAPTGFSLRF